MKKNNKAFTLIELLAIIVILAIIAVITVPIILNIIENSRKGAAIDSAYGYKDAVIKYYVSNMLENQDLKLVGNYVIDEDSPGQLIDVNGKKYPIQISGASPSSGYIIIENNEVSEGCLVIDGYKIKLKDEKFETSGKGECKPFKRVISSDSSLLIGDEVAIGTEHFYIVSTDESKTVLLAQYNLNVGNKCPSVYQSNNCIQIGSENNPKFGLQDSTAGLSENEYVISMLKFSDAVYWYNGSSVKPEYGTGYDENDIYDNNSNLYQYVESYVTRLKGMGAKQIKGRLLTYYEANQFSINHNEKIFNGTRYWLGTVHDISNVWTVTKDDFVTANYGHVGGVRPVIEVNTSDIDL